MDKYLSIVIPIYNEEQSIRQLYLEITKVCQELSMTYEIIYVDDGSEDNSWGIIEQLANDDPHVKAIKLKTNYGQTSAMVAGFEHSSGEVIVTMDGDLQNDPGDIPILLKKMKEGYDVVSGWRKDRKDHISRVIPSKIANAMISFTTGIKLHDYGCSLKAYRSETIKSIKAYGDMHRFFPALAKMTGAQVSEVVVNHRPRRYGTSKYGFDRIFKVFSDLFMVNILIRFSSNPLKGFALCSLPFWFMALFFGMLAVASAALQWTEGKGLFFLIISSLLFMASLHLVVLGILGELIVNVSSLEHTELPEIGKKEVSLGEPFSTNWDDEHPQAFMKIP